MRYIACDYIIVIASFTQCALFHHRFAKPANFIMQMGKINDRIGKIETIQRPRGQTL
jgi:hypothetical protein